MDPSCDLCGVKKAVVYCQSDTARLCVACDECIHSANALSCRHLRSLVCNGCGSEPAIVRCLDDKLSLCQSCQATSCKGGATAAHRRHRVNFYSECPSLEQLSQLWASVIDPEDLKEADASWIHGRAAMNGNYINNSWMQMQKESSSVRLADLDSSHLVPNVNSMASGGDQHVPDLLKACSAPLRDTGQFNGVDDFNLGFDIGDIDFNSGNYDKLGGVKSEPRYHSEDTRMDCLFMDNSFSINDSASFSIPLDGFGLQSSCVPGAAGAIQAGGAGAERVLFNPYADRKLSHSFPIIQAQSNMSLSVSNHTGESSATDYQDCELYPRFLTEVPWDSNIEAPSTQARDKAKMRYNEKKKTRTYVIQPHINMLGFQFLVNNHF
ncbi:hypothetical protein ACLOJK_029275 [Asimina triloba]